MERYLTFSPDWIRPYESPWSIFQKLKSANLISTNELLKSLGSDKVRNLKSGPSYASNTDRNLYTLVGIDNNRCKQIIGFPLVEFCLKNLNSLLNNLPYQSLDFFFRDDLHYCRECMSYGYHSMLFQLKFIHNCPFHENPLENLCPKCNNSISFILSDNGKGKYQRDCKCEFPTSIDFQDFRNWKMLDTSNIRSSTVNHWLNLNEEQILLLKRVHLLERFDLEDYPSFLDSLLSAVINTNTTSFSNEFLPNQVSCTSKIRSMEKIADYNGRFNYSEYLNERLYMLTKQTVSSITNHVKKYLFAKHGSCIKRYTKLLKVPGSSNPSICPYAYTYVKWKQRIYSFRDFYDVDNFGRPLIDNKDYLVFSDIDHELFCEIINKAIRLYKNEIFLYISKIGWLIQRILYHLLMNHLYNFLVLTAEYSRENYQLEFYDLKYRHLDFFFFLWPHSLSEELQFHWFTRGNNNLTDILSTFRCPYPTLNSKRIKHEEYSHHPMKMALNSMHGVEMKRFYT